MRRPGRAEPRRVRSTARDNMLAALAHRHVSGANGVNELRFQLRAARSGRRSRSIPSCNGVCDLENEGGPTLEVIGVASVGPAAVHAAAARTNDRYQFLDTHQRVQAGSHQLKAGIDFNSSSTRIRRCRCTSAAGTSSCRYCAAHSRRSWRADPVSAIQAVALGLPAALRPGLRRSRQPLRLPDISLFAQDDWQLTDRLTLKLGVRYQNQFWPSELRTRSPAAPAPTVPSTATTSRHGSPFAWDPAGNGGRRFMRVRHLLRQPHHVDVGHRTGSTATPRA